MYDYLHEMEKGSVMIPSDDEEYAVVRCFTLAIKAGFNASEIDYLVVRDFSKKYEMDSIELFQMTKRMCSTFNENIPQNK